MIFKRCVYFLNTTHFRCVLKNNKYNTEPIGSVVMDGQGCLYSEDGKKLISIANNLRYYKVKEGTEIICDLAFTGAVDLQILEMPDSVVAIGKSVFRRCESLKTVVISANIDFIDSLYIQTDAEIISRSDRFVMQDSLFVDLKEKRLIQCFSNNKHIVIPNTIEVIGTKAFVASYRYQHIELPNTITTICKNAFDPFTFWVKNPISKSLTYIGDNAFSNVLVDESILILPPNINHIGKAPFYKDIKLQSESERFIVEDDLLIDLKEKRLIQCLKDKKHVVVPNFVTSIGEGAFSSCELLQNIVLSENVTIINNSAFGWCKSLQSIVLPETITEIGNFAFSFCESLQNVILPDRVTAIGDLAFSGCESLQSIVLPKSLASIGKFSIPKEVELTSRSSRFVMVNDLFIDLLEKRLIECRSNNEHIVIPDTIITICDDAFKGCEYMKTISLPNTITTIGYNAFAHCRSLQNISLPNSIMTMGDNAFMDCESLENVILPNLLERIGCAFFVGCSSLKNIEIPNSITSIEARAFMDCKSLETVNLSDSLIDIEESAFYGCSSLQNILLPNSVVRIAEEAFSLCSSLKSFSLPASLEHMEQSIFSDNTEVTSRSERFVVKDGLLIDLEQKRLLTYLKNITHVDIPEGVSVIGKYAFSRCMHLESISLSDSVVKIEDNAFMDCKMLKEISIPNTLTTIGNFVFKGCQLLDELYIPDSIEDIGKDILDLDERKNECVKIIVSKDKVAKLKNILEKKYHDMIRISNYIPNENLEKLKKIGFNYKYTCQNNES